VTRRLRLTLLLLALGALALWKSELFIVARPGDHPLPLRAIAAARRADGHLNVMLPMVPAGAMTLRPESAPIVIQYWAPWMKHAALQAVTLDSMIRLSPVLGTPRAVLVCFDPYPSVTRYVARMQFRVPVLLDHLRALPRALPCPSLPYTYVIDARGRIAAAQAGEVDWLAPQTRAALDSIAAESATPDLPAVPAANPHAS
jgi:hypothetical protein